MHMDMGMLEGAFKFKYHQTYLNTPSNIYLNALVITENYKNVIAFLSIFIEKVTTPELGRIYNEQRKQERNT